MASNNDNKRYRVLQRHRDIVLVDWDGNIVDPKEAETVIGDMLEAIRRPDYVYIGRRTSDGWVKFGRSEDVERRVGEVGIDELLHTITCQRFGEYSAKAVESAFHKLLAVMGYERRGEWFNLDELDPALFLCFKDAETLIDNLDELLKLAHTLWDGDSWDISFVSTIAYWMPALTGPRRWLCFHYARKFMGFVEKQDKHLSALIQDMFVLLAFPNPEVPTEATELLFGGSPLGDRQDVTIKRQLVRATPITADKPDERERFEMPPTRKHRVNLKINSVRYNPPPRFSGDLDD